MSTSISLAPLLERFFTQRLMQQRQASPHTISSYRDTFRQFLKFVQQRLHKPPSRLNFEEIDAPLIVAFLDDLEKHRGVSVRSRNLRLTAIHSFFRLRSVRGTSAFRADPARARHPQQALHAHLGPFSHACRSRCLTGRSGSAHLVWPARSRVSPGGGTDRLRLSEMTGLKREDLILGRRSRARNRQGPQRTLYTHRQIHTRGVESLAA